MSETTALQNIRMFQIYYRPDMLSALDPAFVPYDNTSNERPDLREWWCWNKIHNSYLVRDVEYWGAVSFRFYEKTKISGEKFLEFFKNNPGYDTYYVCPWNIFSVKQNNNVWVQGDVYHPGLSALANEILTKLGFNIDVTQIKMSDAYFYCNFFVANKLFWDSYMKFITSVFEICKIDNSVNDKLLTIGRSNYQDKTTPMFPFFIERMTPTYIVLKKFRALSYNL
jgi:hypothetical protein